MPRRPAPPPWLVAVPLAAAVAASSGCGDRFRPADASAPRVVEVILADEEGALPAREVFPDGNDIRVADVPLTFSRIRVRFSKLMDGSTIQQSPNPTLSGGEPAGNLLPLGCAPAANVQVTQVGGAGAATFTASVCYDPTGPDMLVEPAVATCGGPVPSAAYRAAASSTAGGLPALERGATYTIRASTLKDHQGNALSFTLTVVTSTALALASDPGDPTLQPVAVASVYEGVKVTAYAALDPASTPSGIPPGPPPDPATGAPTPPFVNEKTSFAAFGPDLLVRFDAPLCAPRGDAADLPELPGYCAPAGVDTGSIPGVRVAVGGDPLAHRSGEELATISGAQAAALHFPFAGGYDAISDRYLGGDAGALHVVPWLPLEDGATYSLALDGALTDVTGATLAAPEQVFFQAAAGDFRVQVVQPPDGATGVPPTTDLLHHASAGSGHGIELVASRPLALDGAGRPVGTIELHEGDAAGQLLSADVAALDTRGRWFAIGATTGQGVLALKSGQRYTVVLQGLTSKDDPGVTIPSFQWSFTTAPFSRDAALSVPVVASAIDGADPVPGAAGEVRGPFLVQYVSGRVAHGAAASAVAPQAGGEQFFPLQGPAGGPAPSVSLVKVRDAAGQACATACAVPGISGYVKTTSGLDLFANGAGADPNPNLRTADLAAAKPRAGLPRSAIGFLPDAPLEPGAAYQLTLANVVDVNDVPLADADGTPQPQLTIPFTVRPFAVRRVLSRAALAAGDAGEALQSGARFVAVDGANPLTVELRASPDLPTAGTTTAGDLASDPVALVDLTTGKAVPLALAPDPASTLRLTVKPVSALAPGRTYSLVVTSKLLSRQQAPGSGVPAAPFSLAFTTPEARDAGGKLVCE